MSTETLAVLTSLVSVAVSSFIAIVSLVSRNRADGRAHRRELGTMMLPRRIQAFESAWAAAFEAETNGSISNETQDDLVAAALWLPEDIGQQVLGLHTRTDPIDFASLRTVLTERSGSQVLTELIDHGREN